MKKTSIKELKRFDFDKVFKGEKRVSKDQFVLNTFNNQTFLKFFDRIENQLSKFTDHIERKYKIAIHKYPLDKMTRIYKTEVPSSISILCDNIAFGISKKNFEAEKEIHVMNKGEMVFCESIVNCICSGYVEEIDFSEIPFIIVLNSLKVILRSLPETLFTEIISKKILVSHEYGDDESLFKDILEMIPQNNYKTIKYISKVINQLFDVSSTKVAKSISSFL